MLPIAFGVTEKRTHDYVRHGTTNLFSALNVGTGEVFGDASQLGKDGTFRFSQKSRQVARGQGHPRGIGEPVHGHDPRRASLAGQQSTRPLPLHPNGRILDRSDRDVVWLVAQITVVTELWQLAAILWDNNRLGAAEHLAVGG